MLQHHKIRSWLKKQKVRDHPTRSSGIGCHHQGCKHFCRATLQCMLFSPAEKMFSKLCRGLLQTSKASSIAPFNWLYLNQSLLWKRTSWFLWVTVTERCTRLTDMHIQTCHCWSPCGVRHQHSTNMSNGQWPLVASIQITNLLYETSHLPNFRS